MTLNEIREDLKNIKYYYSKKDLFDNAFETISENMIVDKIKRYNEIIRLASPQLYEVYIALYVQNNTQESFADKLCYSPQYVQVLNKKLLNFIKVNYDNVKGNF